ncbi:hypothetical protein HO173_001301 [Letharia columbiana]|uniref:Uncharacterized protein n=1 Tax=Letharia columbiana TaxID=112416 RepID=A0A8H6G4U0_9LECA|nr:uncharacterized protein HO173_001301 [Letharia columbiana]KAF6240629.1 hypothetical protein HO173_001301 [Letharia columbiana]
MQRVGSLKHNKRGLVQNPVWDGHDLFKGGIAIYRNIQVVFMSTFVDVNIPKDIRGKVSNKTHLGLSIFDNAFYLRREGTHSGVFVCYSRST